MPATWSTLQLAPHQLVLLIAGPAGSGKSSAAAKCAAHSGWVHISEDDVWNEIGHPPEELRTDADQLVVHANVHDKMLYFLSLGKSVALEFILFHNPPWPLTAYQSFLAEKHVPVETRIIRPTLEQLVERALRRGRASDVSTMGAFRANAAHQLSCIANVNPAWVTDGSAATFEEFFEHNFRTLVKKGQPQSVLPLNS